VSGTRFAAEAGALVYEIYCQNCHGPGGRGDGAMCHLLRTPPADLTGLATAHDGNFPAAAVRLAIDGRKDVSGHGRREMPVWGLSLRDPGSDADQAAIVNVRLDQLVAFLRSIQADTDEGDDDQAEERGVEEEP